MRPDLVTQACECQRVRQEARQALVGKPGLLSQEKRREKQKKDVLGKIREYDSVDKVSADHTGCPGFDIRIK